MASLAAQKRYMALYLMGIYGDAGSRPGCGSVPRGRQEARHGQELRPVQELDDLAAGRDRRGVAKTSPTTSSRLRTFAGHELPLSAGGGLARSPASTARSAGARRSSSPPACAPPGRGRCRPRCRCRRPPSRSGRAGPGSSRWPRPASPSSSTTWLPSRCWLAVSGPRAPRQTSSMPGVALDPAPGRVDRDGVGHEARGQQGPVLRVERRGVADREVDHRLAIDQGFEAIVWHRHDARSFLLSRCTRGTSRPR